MKYYQSSGELHLENGIVLKGHAGTPAYSNNPEAQHIEDQGPLPRGRYRMAPRYSDYKRLKAPIIILTPCPGNEMYGRGGFLIHGGGFSDSQGCIVIDGAANRHTIIKSMKAGDDRLEVVR